MTFTHSLFLLFLLYVPTLLAIVGLDRVTGDHLRNALCGEEN